MSEILSFGSVNGIFALSRDILCKQDIGSYLKMIALE